jgi:hypothetical protein
MMGLTMQYSTWIRAKSPTFKAQSLAEVFFGFQIIFLHAFSLFVLFLTRFKTPVVAVSFSCCVVYLY